jgi:hypothetical protein
VFGDADQTLEADTVDQEGVETDDGETDADQASVPLDTDGQGTEGNGGVVSDDGSLDRAPFGLAAAAFLGNLFGEDMGCAMEVFLFLLLLSAVFLIIRKMRGSERINEAYLGTGALSALIALAALTVFEWCLVIPGALCAIALFSAGYLRHDGTRTGASERNKDSVLHKKPIDSILSR